MYLNKPAFPVSFTVENIIGLIESMVKGKSWTKFEVADISLVYIPFWIFNYDAYSEAPSEEGEKVVSALESGKMALNAFTNELDENVGFLYDSGDAEMQQKPTADYPFKIQRPKIRESDAKEITSLRLAAQLGLKKENVIISGLELVYLPIWFTWVTVAEGTYKLQINAVSGEILNEEQVPEREKGWLEVTSETLQDLKQPGVWIEYTQQIGTGVFSFITNNPLIQSIIEQIKTNRKVQTAILAIIAVIIILWTIGFF